MIIKSNKNKILKFKVLSGIKILASCCQSGLFGFAIFFTVLLLSKFLSSLIGSNGNINVDLSDVVLSLIGFVLTFLITLLTIISQNAHGYKKVRREL